MPERWRNWVSDAENVGPEIIHHDEQLLIVHKPPGLPTTAPTPTEPCLTNWVRDRFPDLQAHATSRLDSQVSGLVTFALTRDANRHLLDARRAGTYERIYMGITIREVSVDEGEWSWPISIDPRNPKRRIAGPGRGQREALTRYEVAARRRGGPTNSACMQPKPARLCSATPCIKANGAKCCPKEPSSPRAV